MKKEHHICMVQGLEYYSFTVLTPKDTEIDYVHKQIFQAMAKAINPDWDGTPEGAIKFACMRNNWEYNEPKILVVPEGFF